MKIHKLILFLFLLVSLISSCKKKKPEAQQQPLSQFNLEIKTLWDGQPIKLNTTYINPHGDTFSITKLEYFISNIRLKNSKGDTFSVPDSYYLIDPSVSTDTTIAIPNIPVDVYSEIQLSIGIDSVKNHNQVASKNLDPNKVGEMYWSWNPQYKFFLMEGYYGFQHYGLVFHIVGDENYKTVTFGASNPNWQSLDLKSTNATVTISAEIQEAFETPYLIDFSKTHNVAGGSATDSIGTNYENMLQLTSIKS